MTRLLGGRTLEQLLPVRREETTRFVKSMLNKAKANERVDVGGELLNTNNVTSRMAVGKRSGGNETEADEIRRMVKSIAELKGRLNLADFIWFRTNLDLQGFGKRLREVRDKFGTMIDRIIKEHQEARKTKSCDGHDAVRDILDILLEISEDETAEIRLTRENIKSFFLDIFAAGTDTSALTTEWALAELINHPDVMKKARQEIDYIVGKKRLVQESDIANLPYLQAIVKETLRLHPTGSMIVRESSESCTIRGFEIPAKTRLFVNVWAINRDPNYWEKPFEFEPERFLGEDGKKLDVRGQHFHLLPFGYGRRGCPGISLALPVVQTTIAAMIQCFEWKVVHRNGEVNFSGTAVVDMDEGLGLTLPRAHPLVCVPLARLNPFPSID